MYVYIQLIFKCSDVPPPNAATRTYNSPSCTEVAAIIVGDNEAKNKRYVTISNNGEGLQFIPSTHTSYDPLSYLITHMHGDKGWTTDIPRWKNTVRDWTISNKKVSTMDFYAYRAQVRDPADSPDIVKDALLKGGLLAHQYWCDQW